MSIFPWRSRFSRSRTKDQRFRTIQFESLESRLLFAVDLRIASYNITGDARSGMDTVLRAFGDQVVNGVSRPVDIIALQETDSQATDTQTIVNLLNTIYGANTYARGNTNGATTGAGTQGIVYRTSTVQLVAETAFGSSVPGGVPRQVLRYQLHPVGFASTNDFYLYVAHPKASDTTADANIRNDEAFTVRLNMDALPQGTNIIYAADTNFYRSTEPGWTTFTNSGNGQLFDPINQVGNWNNNAAFAAVHTQSPTTSARFPGQVTGGMDDRFDMQLVSNELTDGVGLDITPSTYRVLGNNGSTFNGDIDSPANTWVWNPVAGSTVTRSALLTALASITDHLPVIADYTIVGATDTTPPTLQSIDDGDADNLVAVNTTMTYTVTFSEDIINTGNGAFTAADLNNAGTAAITFGTITETTPGVFTVQVTPTSAGTIILRIPTGAVVTDLTGNTLVVPVQDNDTITVDAIAPTIGSTNFVDNEIGRAHV